MDGHRQHVETRGGRPGRDGGFTLLEMSIVLTIVGLLTGGILAGQSLIRQSEVNGVYADVRRYIAAVNGFKTKYQALPGDYNGAVQLWGAAAGDASDNYTASCYGTVGTGTQTCNGNGNGVWEPGVPNAEVFLAWQHLANAGLVEGQYSGQVLYPAQPGVNVPASRVSGAGFTFWDNGNNVFSDVNWYPAYWGKVILFGRPGVDRATQLPVVTALEAAGIDTKYDDGLPATGKVAAYVPGTSTAPNCTSSADPTQAQYNVTTPGVTCNLVFARITQ